MPFGIELFMGFFCKIGMFTDVQYVCQWRPLLPCGDAAAGAAGGCDNDKGGPWLALGEMETCYAPSIPMMEWDDRAITRRALRLRAACCDLR